MLGAQQVLDRRRRLRDRLLARRMDLGDLEDVVAELGLERTLNLAGRGAEDRRVERLLLLPAGHPWELAAGRLRGAVDRVLLGDGRPRLAGPDRGERRVRLVRLAGQDDLQVTGLRLSETLLVL